jgi:hypothetical protein
MAQGLFIVGFTVAEVVLIQSDAEEMLIVGKTLMNWADGGPNATRQFAMPVKEVLEECAFALRSLDPETEVAHRRTAQSGVSAVLLLWNQILRCPRAFINLPAGKMT